MNAPPTELDRQLLALGDEHPEQAHAASRWLVAHPELARPALLELLGRGGDDLASRRSLDVLAELGDPRDVPLFASKMETGDTFAARAAFALGRHPAPEALAALVASARSPRGEVAREAVAALGARADERARGAIEAALNHSDRGVRYRAAGALAALGAKPSRGALQARRDAESDAEVRVALEKALATTGTR